MRTPRQLLLAGFARRAVLALGITLVGSSLLAGCTEDDPPSGSAPAGGTGNVFQFTLEGPGFAKRTATFRPTTKDVSFPGGEAWFNVGSDGTNVDPVSEEGEAYGQIFFHLSEASSQVGSYTKVQDQLQIAVYRAPGEGSKAVRARDEDGVPGGLDVVITKRGAKEIEGTFSGTLNCTNCRPTESFTLTAGSFRLVD